MKSQCQICLTKALTRGYLVPSLTLTSMERTDLVESNAIAESPEREQPGMMARLRSLARNKLAAATLAVAGSAAVVEKADAGLVYPGEFRRPTEVNQLPEQITVGFDIQEEAFLRIVNGSDATHEDINAIGIFGNNGEYAIDFSLESDSDVPIAINPNSLPSDGIHHDVLVIEGMQPLPELQHFRLGIDVDPTVGNPDGPADFGDFISGATIIVGKNGQLQGTPTTPQEFISMFSGEMWQATYPQDASSEQNYVLTEATSVPEPSGAAYLGLAGAAAAAAAARRKRRGREGQ